MFLSAFAFLVLGVPSTFARARLLLLRLLPPQGDIISKSEKDIEYICCNKYEKFHTKGISYVLCVTFKTFTVPSPTLSEKVKQRMSRIIALLINLAISHAFVFIILSRNTDMIQRTCFHMMTLCFSSYLYRLHPKTLPKPQQTQELSVFFFAKVTAQMIHRKPD